MARFYWLTSYQFLGLLMIRRKKWTSLGYKNLQDFWHSKTMSCGHLAYGFPGWCLILTDIPFSFEFLSENHDVKPYFFIPFWPCSPSVLRECHHLLGTAFFSCTSPPSKCNQYVSIFLPLLFYPVFSYLQKEKKSLHFSFVGYMQ